MSSYLRVLRHPDFRYLFLGQSASAVGDQVVFVALALYVTERTGSATDLGLILAAQTISLVGLVLFGGVWADRLPRHRIMIAADLMRMVLHAVLAALILAGGATVAEMIVIETLFGAARAFFQPAYSGLLPQTVSEAEIQDARALSESTANLAILIGPALGTVLVLTVGAGEAFALDSATFALSAILLTRVHPRERGVAPAGAGAAAGAGTEPSSMLHDLRTGWYEVRSRPWVWVTILAFTGAVLCAYAQWNALAPSIARDSYGGAGLFGVLESVAGGGAVIGAVAAIRWRPARPLVVGLLLTFPWTIQSIAFALLAPVPVLVVCALTAGFGFSVFEIWWMTALSRQIPPRALSRVASYDWMGSLALLPLGLAVAGPLAAAFGARTVLGVGAVLALAMLALALVPRSTRELADVHPRELAGGDPREPVGAGPAESAQDFAGDVVEEAGREPEIAHVDSLVGVMHKGGGLE